MSKSQVQSVLSVGIVLALFSSPSSRADVPWWLTLSGWESRLSDGSDAADASPPAKPHSPGRDFSLNVAESAKFGGYQVSCLSDDIHAGAEAHGIARDPGLFQVEIHAGSNMRFFALDPTTFKCVAGHRPDGVAYEPEPGRLGSILGGEIPIYEGEDTRYSYRETTYPDSIRIAGERRIVCKDATGPIYDEDIRLTAGQVYVQPRTQGFTVSCRGAAPPFEPAGKPYPVSEGATLAVRGHEFECMRSDHLREGFSKDAQNLVDRQKIASGTFHHVLIPKKTSNDTDFATTLLGHPKTVFSCAPNPNPDQQGAHFENLGQDLAKFNGKYELHEKESVSFDYLVHPGLAATAAQISCGMEGGTGGHDPDSLIVNLKAGETYVLEETDTFTAICEGGPVKPKGHVLKKLCKCSDGISYSHLIQHVLYEDGTEETQPLDPEITVGEIGGDPKAARRACLKRRLEAADQCGIIPPSWELKKVEITRTRF